LRWLVASLIGAADTSAPCRAAIMPHRPWVARSMAATPSWVARTRSKAVGVPPRWTWTWPAFALDLNRAGAMARDAGLKLGYHNHNWEFFRLTDDPTRTAYDVLTETTDPDLVLDLFWVTRGARDPVDVIQENEGRVLQYHVKDMNQAGSFADPGRGLIDFPRIFEHSKTAGVVEYIVERDDAGSPPRTPADALDTAEVGYDYLATVRF
jgi:sugar phosphate isomerase/epimerase